VVDGCLEPRSCVVGDKGLQGYRKAHPELADFASRANRQPAFGPMVNHAANGAVAPDWPRRYAARQWVNRGVSKAGQ
jgi:hypothetical protein